MNDNYQRGYQSPAQQTSRNIQQEIEQAQIENLIQQQRGFGVEQDKFVAQTTAQGVVGQALRARQGQTVEGIRQLENQLQEQYEDSTNEVAQEIKQVIYLLSQNVSKNNVLLL